MTGRSQVFLSFLFDEHLSLPRTSAFLPFPGMFSDDSCVSISRANSSCNGEKSPQYQIRDESIQKKTGSGSIDNWSCKCMTMKENGFIICCH